LVFDATISSKNQLMRNLFIPLFLLIGISVFSQNDSTEKAILHKRVVSNQITQAEFARIANNWNRITTSVNGYPELPFNQGGQVHYVFLNNFENIKKDLLFHRTLEYLAVNYGLLPNFMYSNEQDGKIIFTNSFNADNRYTFNYTGVISVKDSRMMIEFIKISLSVDTEWGQSTSGIEKTFPIITRRMQEWQPTLNMLKKVDEFFNSEINGLSEFIRNYETNYSF
jgi:hypothetical protein